MDKRSAMTTPAARWGHQALYVDSLQAMYVIGGEVQSSGTQVTNEVLVLPLNATSPSFQVGVNTGLPPHAFAAAAITRDSSSIVIVGGMTSACSSDALAHTLSLSGDGTWTSVTPSQVARRRGAGMAWVDNQSSGGEMLLVGGLSDSFVCATSTSGYPAADVLSLPLGTSSLVSTRYLPTSLTGSELAIADFGMTTATDGSIYLAGGQDASGALVSLSTIGRWTNTTGWTSQVTSGDVPTGRVGASLVAHPFLDMLVLHGGSTTDDATTDTPSTLVAFLNTTTWAWSTPSNLQPPASSAVAYHSSVMTPSGVMITAFGLGSSNAPRSDMYYLDMRDPSASAWSWKSVWSTSMLSSYTASTGTVGTTNAANTSGSHSSSETKKETTKIAVPVILVCLLLLPILIFFIRRRVRLIRKRRQARHFSFSSQEDEGDFRRPIDQFQASRRTKTQYSFGRDANEKDGNLMSDIGTGIVGMLKRYATNRPESPSDHRGSKGSKLAEKAIKWEEIDFGLGKLDENRLDGTHSRRSSFSAPSGSPDTGRKTPEALPYQMPVASTARGYDTNLSYSASAPIAVENPFANPTLIVTDEDLSGTPRHDGQAPLVPILFVQAPTMPSTPSENPNPFGPAYPVLIPERVPTPSQGLDWSILAQELEARPAFRSISPTATLRSHAHALALPPRSSSPAPANATPPILPPLGFQRPSSASSHTISLVNPKTGRRSSEILPFSSQPASPRSVSQPMGPRQLAGNYPNGRRGSGPYAPLPVPRSTSPRVSYDAGMRRASNPNTLGSEAASPVVGPRRESKLRVVNLAGGEVDEGQAV